MPTRDVKQRCSISEIFTFHRWWAQPTLRDYISTLLMWSASLNAALGGTTPFNAYEQHPEAKYLMMSIFSIVSTAHLIVFFVATRALVYERRRGV